MCYIGMAPSDKKRAKAAVDLVASQASLCT
jgi:hypothetical protein